MDTPFPYDKFVTGKNFIGRKSDCTILSNLLSQGEHVTIYEPPKTGKTSLIQQALFSMRFMNRTFTVGQFSVLNIRTVDDFLLRYGSTVIRMVASTPTEYARIVAEYLQGTHFVFDENAFADRDQLLSRGWDLDDEDVKAVLRLPFRIAEDRGKPLILIIDEFQNVNETEDGDRILRPLDAIIKEEAVQGRKSFSFIFCGSMVNAMKGIFETSLLFHRHVTRIKLSPVDEREIADHVVKGFLSGGKVLDKDLLIGACRLFQGHFWYINHFASICDSMSKGYIMEPVLVDALGSLIAVHEPRFRAMVSGLTTHQVNLLRATVDGNTRFSASEIIRKYSLNSSANVKRVKDALMKKEILTFDADDKPSFLDPLFEYWVKKYYYELPE
ncbi:MAG: ATP-binding protein [Bacteroidales bacterium]|nr:ATP-binding protein [Bacteroidales bacterium]